MYVQVYISTIKEREYTINITLKLRWHDKSNDFFTYNIIYNQVTSINYL